VFLLNIFLFYLQKIALHSSRNLCAYIAEANFYVLIWEIECDKIFKTHDYFLVEIQAYLKINKLELNEITSSTKIL